MPELVPEWEQLPRRMQEQTGGSSTATVGSTAVDEQIMRPHELGGAAAGTILGNNVSTRPATSSRQDNGTTAAAIKCKCVWVWDENANFCSATFA